MQSRNYNSQLTYGQVKSIPRTQSYTMGKLRNTEAGMCRERDSSSEMVRKQIDAQRSKERERHRNSGGHGDIER